MRGNDPRRLSGAHQPSPGRLARIATTGALLTGGISIAFFVGPNAVARGVSLDLLWPLSCVACVAIGIGLTVLAVLRPRLRAWLAAFAVLAALPMCFYFGRLSGDAPWRAVIVASLGALWVLVRRGQAVEFAAWVGVQCAVVSYGLETSGATLALLLVAAACAAAALAHSHRSVTLHRFTRRRMVRSTISPPHDRESVSLRSAFGGALVAATAVLLVALGRDAHERMLDDGRRAGESEASRMNGRKQRSSAPQYIAGVTLADRVGDLSDEVLATVSLRDEASGERLTEGRPLYFAAANLDAFEGDRMEPSEDFVKRVVRDGDDGRIDGWVELRSRRSGDVDPAQKLVVATVRQDPALNTSSGLAGLLRLETVLAVRLEEITSIDGVALLATPSRNWPMEYELLSAPSAVSSIEKSGGVSPRDRRYLALPPRSAALDAIQQWAEDAARGAVGDERRTAAIAQRLSSFEYRYETLPARGIEGLARMLELRAGYCTPIAAVCVIMLRSQGIPSRGVVGFVGAEFDSVNGEYVLRQRHGHAWVEAHFPGVGWKRIDPTPPSSRPDSPSAGSGDPLQVWGNRLAADYDALASGFDGAGMRRVASRLAEAPLAWLEAARERRISALAVGAVVALASIWLLARLARRLATVARERLSPAGRALAFEQRLIDELVEHGARAEDSSTLREIGVSAEPRLDGGLGAKLRAGIAALYAARFGGEELDGAARESLEALIDELRAWRKARRAQSA